MLAAAHDEQTLYMYRLQLLVLRVLCEALAHPDAGAEALTFRGRCKVGCEYLRDLVPVDTMCSADCRQHAVGGHVFWRPPTEGLLCPVSGARVESSQSTGAIRMVCRSRVQLGTDSYQHAQIYMRSYLSAP